MKKSTTFLTSGILASLAASLCCVTPFLAFIAGSSSLLTSFLWLEPLRPFLIGFTLAILALTWFQHIHESKRTALACEASCPPKASFLQGRQFLGAVTVFALLMLSFPSYSSFIYPTDKEASADLFNTQTVEFSVQGMTCSGCEGSVNLQAKNLDGVHRTSTSYDQSNTIISFDPKITTPEQIQESLQKTGYHFELKETSK